MGTTGKVLGGLALLLFGVWVAAPDLVLRYLPLLLVLGSVAWMMWAMGHMGKPQPSRRYEPGFDMEPAEGLTRAERLKRLRQEQLRVQAEIAALRLELPDPDTDAAALPAPNGTGAATGEAASQRAMAPQAAIGH